MKKIKKDRIPEFQCMECGRAFYSTKTAQRARTRGCPKCKGVDIDIFVSSTKGEKG